MDVAEFGPEATAAEEYWLKMLMKLHLKNVKEEITTVEGKEFRVDLVEYDVELDHIKTHDFNISIYLPYQSWE